MGGQGCLNSPLMVIGICINKMGGDRGNPYPLMVIGMCINPIQWGDKGVQPPPTSWLKLERLNFQVRFLHLLYLFRTKIWHSCVRSRVSIRKSIALNCAELRPSVRNCTRLFSNCMQFCGIERNCQEFTVLAIARK